jgi:hypothetical protein
MAPHCHLVVDVTIISACTNANVPRIGARFPLLGSLALGAQHGKLDADLRTSALLGKPSVQLVRDYYRFAMKDGGRLTPMSAELVDRRAILVAVRRFPCMGNAHSRSLRFDSYVCMQQFIRRTNHVRFRGFWGMCDVSSCNVVLLLFMVLWVPISETLCRRAVMTLWHAFMFLGLRFIPVFVFLLGGRHCFFL